jgi:hypothetical protein
LSEAALRKRGTTFGTAKQRHFDVRPHKEHSWTQPVTDQPAANPAPLRVRYHEKEFAVLSAENMLEIQGFVTVYLEACEACLARYLMRGMP